VFFIFLCVLIIKEKGIDFFISKIKRKFDKNNKGYSTEYLNFLNKVDSFEKLGANGGIYFLGDSIIEGCQWNELFNNSSIKNRGISSNTTQNILERLDEVVEAKPQKVFLLIGINDLLTQVNFEIFIDNYKKILSRIREESPNTIIYIHSILPLNRNIGNFGKVKNKDVINANNKILKFADSIHIIYVNLYDNFLENNILNTKFSFDGIHLNGQGYLAWKQVIQQYVNVQ